MSNPEEAANFEVEEENNFNEGENNFNEEENNFNEEENTFNEEENTFNEEEGKASSTITFTISYSQDVTDYDMCVSRLVRDTNFCRAYYIGFEFDTPTSTKLTFKIPTTILPLSVSVVNGFYDNPYLINCEIDFQVHNTYTLKPDTYNFANPSYGFAFPGSILIKNRFRNFFSTDYKPSNQYRCQNYVLAPQVSADPEKIEKLVQQLVNEGFSSQKAQNALIFSGYDINKARDHLLSGLLEQRNFDIPVQYPDCPLFYLVLEICEAFFDMGDCCCVCGKKLGIYHLKPACCNEDKCQFAFINLGVGSNIIGEIKRDPIATEFIIALAGAASAAPPDPPVFDPAPESQGIKFSPKFFQRLPSMKDICARCQTDSDLREMIGDQDFEVLRFFILANKAQFITLPEGMKTSLKTPGLQFLVTSVSPESELRFRKKREKFGVKWLCHGSRADRWYRIMHTGLRDLGRTNYQLNGGPWFGDGIYMSDQFLTSLGYTRSVPNVYKKSKLPKNLSVISLVENAAVPQLVGPVAPNEYTQRDEEACITRVLFLIDSGNNNCNIPYQNLNYNVLVNPPKVPTLHEVLSFQMKKYIKT